MDPDAAVEALRRLSKDLETVEDAGHRSAIAEEMATVWDGLDEWITRGGFLPSAWRRPQ